MNILLVDDHGIFREGMALLLKSLDPGITVAHARSARECLDKAATEIFDLVLLDLGLPDKPGLEALSDLKHARPELPVVVLSGQEGHDTVLDSIKRGAMGFICANRNRDDGLLTFRHCGARWQAPGPCPAADRARDFPLGKTPRRYHPGVVAQCRCPNHTQRFRLHRAARSHPARCHRGLYI